MKGAFPATFPALLRTKSRLPDTVPDSLLLIYDDRDELGFCREGDSAARHYG